jgi:hypothetical protein
MSQVLKSQKGSLKRELVWFAAGRDRDNNHSGGVPQRCAGDIGNL